MKHAASTICVHYARPHVGGLIRPQSLQEFCEQAGRKAAMTKMLIRNVLTVSVADDRT